jgi:Leucine-rich repeat (LRR) protein
LISGVALAPSNPVTEERVCNIVTSYLRICTFSNITNLEEDLGIDQPSYMQTKLTITDSTIQHLPPSLPELMSELIVVNCGLQHLFTGDKSFLELRMLNVSNNKILKLDDSTFFNTPNLEVLNLASNQISVLKGAVFYELVHLRELDLSHNQLPTINFLEIFPVTTDNHSIDINVSHNQLKRVIGLCKLTALRKVDFSYNFGLELTGCWTKSLQELSINGINLAGREASLMTLEKFENLDTLSLEENSINRMVFPQLKKLTRLSLAGNKLADLEYEEIEKKWPNLKTLNVTNNNPWNCDALPLTRRTAISGIDCISNDKNKRTRLVLLGLLVGCVVTTSAVIGKCLWKKHQVRRYNMQARESTHLSFNEDLFDSTVLANDELPTQD